MESYDEFLCEVLDRDLMNVIHIAGLIKENEDMLQKVSIEREIAFSEKVNTEELLKLVDEQKSIMLQLQSNKDSLSDAKSATSQSIDKILFLIDEAEKEIQEIEKIRFVNKKLKLFTPNTCPYCLREVERIENKCLCGHDIAEEEYEKFFYTDQEYLDILKVKKKAILSLRSLLDRKNVRIKNISSDIVDLDDSINYVRRYITDLTKDIGSDYNSAYIRQLDNRECELKTKISELQQAEDLAQKKEKLAIKVNKLRTEVSILKARAETLLSAAKEDILIKINDFGTQYMELMKLADAHCYDAYIGEDYMPYINSREYRERSASVPRRLMFFLTLLIESLENQVNYPKFLMIDTPNKEGIDKENLIINIGLLSKAFEHADENNSFQIILTTGIDTYPEDFKKYVFMKLEGNKYLLKENIK